MQTGRLSRQVVAQERLQPFAISRVDIVMYSAVLAGCGGGGGRARGDVQRKNQSTLYLESLTRYMPLTEPDSSGYVAGNYVFAQLLCVHERQTSVNPGHLCFPASSVQFCRSRYENVT